MAVGVVLFVASVSPARAQQPAVAGYVKTVSGAASVIRNGQEQPLVLGSAVTAGDSIKTGADGRIGVTLKDDTRLSLGPNTEIALARFAYAPTEGQIGLLMRVVRGALAYVSGRIAKLSPESIRIETPTSILGVRGTHLLISVGQP
jgi:hypothetical protein